MVSFLPTTEFAENKTKPYSTVHFNELHPIGIGYQYNSCENKQACETLAGCGSAVSCREESHLSLWEVY